MINVMSRPAGKAGPTEPEPAPAPAGTRGSRWQQGKAEGGRSQLVGMASSVSSTLGESAMALRPRGAAVRAQGAL